MVGVLFISVDLFIGGFRNHIFVKEFIPDISKWVSFRANLANIFMGAVTPGQSGGGLAQWYIYLRNGLKLSDVVGVSFYNWISTLIFFPISGALALYVLKDNIPEGFALQLTKFAFSVFTTLLVVIVLGLFAPKVISAIIRGIVLVISKFKPSYASKVQAAGTNGIDKLSEYRKKYLGLIQKKPQLMLYSFLLTLVLYFNKYALAYVFVFAFGVDISFWSIIAVMAVAYLLLYFSPSPGGSGIAELGMTALLVANCGF